VHVEATTCANPFPGWQEPHITCTPSMVWWSPIMVCDPVPAGKGRLMDAIRVNTACMDAAGVAQQPTSCTRWQRCTATGRHPTYMGRQPTDMPTTDAGLGTKHSVQTPAMCSPHTVRSMGNTRITRFGLPIYLPTYLTCPLACHCQPRAHQSATLHLRLPASHIRQRPIQPPSSQSIHLPVGTTHPKYSTVQNLRGGSTLRRQQPVTGSQSLQLQSGSQSVSQILQPTD
jgi:hypothetical protein